MGFGIREAKLGAAVVYVRHSIGKLKLFKRSKKSIIAMLAVLRTVFLRDTMKQMHPLLSIVGKIQD